MGGMVLRSWRKSRCSAGPWCLNDVVPPVSEGLLSVRNAEAAVCMRAHRCRGDCCDLTQRNTHTQMDFGQTPLRPVWLPCHSHRWHKPLTHTLDHKGLDHQEKLSVLHMCCITSLYWLSPYPEPYLMTPWFPVVAEGSEEGLLEWRPGRRVFN